MPLYEYECQECGTRFEVLQRLKERPLKKAECDACEEVRPVSRLVSAPAFQFKGEGWYVTDYAKKDGKNKKGGSSDDGSSEASSDSSSDAKPSASETKDTKSKDKSSKSKKGSDKAKGSD